MSTDVFSNFGALDELIQVIYQSAYRFVVLSSVSDDNWTIHLGLSGSQGRWWKGIWTEANVHQTLGKSAQDSLLEKYADSIAELFIEGELYIGNVNPTPEKKLRFTIGPGAQRPTHVELTELAPAEAADFATTIFLDIALQAQSRKCRLHGSSGIVSSKENSSSTRTAEQSVQQQTARNEVASTSRISSKAREQSSISEAEKQKKRPSPAEKPVPVIRPHKGASLANPNKKARKYQKVEFDSDDDE
ncbi:hypothetical protein FA15DRAFT_683004 [Coprinopsis marcescibilis]|uniref:Uncharacterized protein n=1 Tax=Coprinopsis marcescibilis TaxID=230819 RepID=A0A5C3KH70_COPMA|nr:hypothetical protein FA15DRAFT_683004 [Coprinopsis marcescibilis]